MSNPLRELLAEFVVSVDKAGELARGNAQVDALKAKLGELQRPHRGLRGHLMAGVGFRSAAVPIRDALKVRAPSPFRTRVEHLKCA
jgi:hypothetical protein